MKCDKCGAEVPVTEVLTSMPPQYKGTCPNCGNIVIDSGAFQEVTGATIKVETKPAIKEYQQKFIQLLHQAENDLGCKIASVNLDCSTVYTDSNTFGLTMAHADARPTKRQVRCRIITESED